MSRRHLWVVLGPPGALTNRDGTASPYLRSEVGKQGRVGWHAQGFVEQRSVGMGPAAGANLLSGPRARPRLPRAWVRQMKRPRVQQPAARIRRFGTGELRQWVPVPGPRRSWAGVPKGRMGMGRMYTTVCLSRSPVG